MDQTWADLTLIGPHEKTSVWVETFLSLFPQVHYMTHGANNSSARRGRKLAIENTMALLGTDGKRVPEMFPKEIMAPSVSVDPVMWNQYATMLNGGLAMKTNEISVIQSGGIPTLPVSLGAMSTELVMDREAWSARLPYHDSRAMTSSSWPSHGDLTSLAPHERLDRKSVV